MAMDLQGISAAATVAIACAIVFLLAARTWQLLNRYLMAHSRFPDSITYEAAQRFRDQLSDLSRTQSAYLGAGLVFIVIYIAWATLQGPNLFDGYPDWQLYVLLAALGAAALFAAWRLTRSFMAWREVRYTRDAVTAIGHELQRIGPDSGRAYHDVPTAGGTIDHVLIGRRGVYAINVIAIRAPKGGQARLRDGQVQFSTGVPAIHTARFVKANRQLEKQLSKQAGRNIQVRSVVAVPGWNVQSQEDANHLLATERTLPMIRGWQTAEDHLMNEEAAELQALLTQRCRRNRR